MRTIISKLTLNQYTALVTGIPKFAPSLVFSVNGQTYNATEAVAYINVVLNAVSAAATAKGAWKNAQAAEQTAVAQHGATVKEFRDAMQTMFNNDVNTLAALEIPQRLPPKPLSAEARLAATAKLRATRKARGITSKKQQAAITGNVTGVTITPVTTDTTPTTPVTPVALQPVTPAVTPPAAPPPTPAIAASGSGTATHS